MDAGYPERNGRDVFRPLAWVLSRFFAADCARRPWRALAAETDATRIATFTFGWVTAAAGVKVA